MQKRDAITISDEAYMHLSNMFETAPEGTKAIKIGLKNAGCAGMAYVMDFTDEISKLDEIITHKDITISIDSKSLLFLLGTHLDYKTEKLRSGFIFENPNQTDACGCGESVKLEPVVKGETN